MDDYSRLVDKYRNDPEWKFIDRGQNGSVYKKGDEAIKITTDSVELEHAQILNGKVFPSLVPIYDLQIIKPNLGTFKMPTLKPVPGKTADIVDAFVGHAGNYIESGDENDFDGEININGKVTKFPNTLKKFFRQVRKDFQKAGIPLDEFDIHGANVMLDSNDNLKLIDI
jgi:hypothetical protein